MAATQTAQYELFSAPRVEIVQSKRSKYAVAEVPSSDGKRMYRVDMTNRRCSCPAWTFSRERKVCKHLKAFGFTDLMAKPVTDFSKEL